MPSQSSEFERSIRTGRIPLSAVGRVATRVGVGLLVAAAPLALATVLAVVLVAPTLGDGLEAVLAAASGPLGTGGGLPWLLHVGVVGVLAGCWILGAGLLLSGVAD